MKKYIIALIISLGLILSNITNVYAEEIETTELIENKEIEEQEEETDREFFESWRKEITLLLMGCLTTEIVILIVKN